MKNKIFAIPAAPAAMFVNPNIAATMAINKNVAAHFNIICVFSYSTLLQNDARIKIVYTGR
jgi:hypothetical protein